MRMDIIIRGGVKYRKINKRHEAHCSYRVLTWDNDETCAPNSDVQTLNLGVKFQYNRPVKNKEGTGTVSIGNLKERHAIILCLFQVFMHIKKEDPSKVKINFVTNQEDGKCIFDAINGIGKPPFGWLDEVNNLREKFTNYEKISTEFVTKDTIDAMIGEPFKFPEERHKRLRKEKKDRKKSS